MTSCNCVLTEQEKRIMSGNLRMSPRPRIDNFLKNFRDDVPRIDVQRAVLFTESMQQTEAYPMNLRWAMALDHVFRNLDVVIQDDELIVGTCGGAGRHAILFPELRGGWFEKGLRETQKGKAYRISDEAIEEVMEKVVPYWRGKTAHERYLAILPPETKAVIYGDDDYGATGLMQDNSNINATLNWAGDYGKVITKGLRAIIDETKEKLAQINVLSTEQNYDKAPFLEAFIIVCEGLIAYAKRYAAKAREMAAAETNPSRKAELEKIAANCEQVPEYPARDFHEALQCQWFVMTGYKLEQPTTGVISLGRFDQYMYPTYKQDIANGTLDEEKALELIECLWFKIANYVPFNPTNAGNFWEGYAHFEQTLIGGQTIDGQDATNELSYLLIRSKKEFPMHYPDLSVRLHSRTPNTFLHAVAELIKEGSGFPKILNDEEIIPQLISEGATLQEARDYVGCACTEIRMINTDTYMAVGGNINLGSALEMAMNDGVVVCGGKTVKLMQPSIAAKDLNSYEDLFANLKETVDFFVQHFFKRQTALELTNAAKLAAPFMSGLNDACMKAMKDVHQPITEAGLSKDTGNVNMNGFGTCAESLAAIKKIVFEEQRITLQELKDALAANYEGYEPIRQMLLNAPKYGNNDVYADEVARQLDEMLLDTVKQYRTPNGEQHIKFVPVTSHVGMGGKLGATANGRRAGEAMSEGISPTQGADLQGPLATLVSIDRAKSRKYNNSLARLLNVKINPAVVAGEKGTQDLMNFLRAFVDLKLWHIQFSIINSDTLRAAQNDPEKYRNLIVRVAGYSAYFTELSPALQTEIIHRTEHQAI